MRKIYLITFVTALIVSSTNLNATVWSISTPGTFFSPNLITITLGDTVDFTPITTSHDAREVTQATWMANGNTWNGGFQTPFGGALVIPTLVQTYYYVCTPHANQQMKGRIIVNTNTGINNPSAVSHVIQFFPNPAVSVVQINSSIKPSDKFQMNVYNIAGKKVFSKENISSSEWLNVSLWAKGIYFVEIRNSQKVYARKLEVTR